MNEAFETTGGARIGSTNAPWPFAKLVATSKSLRLKVGLLGDYTFPSDQVVAITRYTTIPILGWGLQIQHCIADYPARIIFWCLGSPDALLASIRETGFQPEVTASAIPPREGLALRWQAILVAVLAWNGLFLLDFISAGKFAGPFSILALGLVLVASVAALRVPSFQPLIIKPGRSVGEIRPLLNLLLFVSGLMFVVLTFFNVFGISP